MPDVLFYIYNLTLVDFIRYNSSGNYKAPRLPWSYDNYRIGEIQCFYELPVSTCLPLDFLPLKLSLILCGLCSYYKCIGVRIAPHNTLGTVYRATPVASTPFC